MRKGRVQALERCWKGEMLSLLDLSSTFPNICSEESPGRCTVDLPSVSFIMVFRRISRDLMDRCVFLRAQGYLSDDICEILGVFARSVQRWTRYARQYGSVIPPHNPTQGRPPILNIEWRGRGRSLRTRCRKSQHLFIPLLPVPDPPVDSDEV